MVTQSTTSNFSLAIAKPCKDTSNNINNNTSMKQVKAFRCDFCGKLYARKAYCLEHEEHRCTKNPCTRPICYNCNFYESVLVEENITYINGVTPWGEEMKLSKKFSPSKCMKKECKLYFDIKLSDEMKGALSDNGYIAMPTHTNGGCKYFEMTKTH